MSERASVVPATLSFFAIYNPSLSTSDETLEDQIVYYYSKPKNGQGKAREAKTVSQIDETKEEKEEKLRQIGLAQGMVSFANNFSNGKPVDCIETEKSRIILHELEPNWWTLASIDLTRLPSSSDAPAHGLSTESELQIEYSAREVCPPALLLQQVLRAHRIVLLHQGSSMNDLYTRVGRQKFCGFLTRFWDRFIGSWDVLLHGNPAVDICNGIKLAAGGELGIGVGEEEWGSGEREVLEGFIGRTEGLVDLIVSRFGEAPRSTGSGPATVSLEPTSQDNNPQLERIADYSRPADGVVFSGIGALTRLSVSAVSSWMEWLHRYGKDAYGVQDNPSAPRRKRRKLHSSIPAGHETATHAQQQTSSGIASEEKKPQVKHNGALEEPGIPPSIVTADRIRNAALISSQTKFHDTSTDGMDTSTDAAKDENAYGTETVLKYLTLGVYGSSWGIPSGRPPIHSRGSNPQREAASQSAKFSNSSDTDKTMNKSDASGGYFLIGLLGELEEGTQEAASDPDAKPSMDAENKFGDDGSNARIMMRTLHVERVKRKPPDPNNKSLDAKKETTETYHDRLRVVVYIRPPFVFTFLFELHTDALAMPFYYRSLHHQIGPLQRPLLSSTSPSKVSERLWEAAAPKSTASTSNNEPIWDLVYDPERFTVHTTIPNVPEPGLASSNGDAATPWTRVEALSVHLHVLNTYTSTRRHTSELERTCKTSRGWWIVWMRLPPFSQKQNTDSAIDTCREAFLVRKASDYVSPAARKSRGRFGRVVSGANESGRWGPGKLAEGIGIDARQYIEGLLSLNR